MNTKQTVIKTAAVQPIGFAIKQKVRFGKPCVRGTRVAIADILNLLRTGYALTDIPVQYPDITLNDAEAALRYTARILGNEEILEIENI